MSSESIYSEDMLEKYYRMRDKQKRKPKPSKPIREAKPIEEAKPIAKPVEEDKRIQESKQKPSEGEVQQPVGIDLWQGRRVRVHMRSGQVFEGLCKVVWRYEFLLDTGEKTIDIFKHAVEWIELLD